jgi:EpsI family protein
MRKIRFWTLVALLAGAALTLFSRSSTDLTPMRMSLSQVPGNIAGWTGTDLRIDAETLRVLGEGEFLSRTYTGSSHPQKIGLFIAYFPSQRTGVTIHSPQNCLPGAGWSFEASRTIDLADSNRKPHRVGEYIVANGESRQFVIYWYQAHGRSIANEYVAKAYMIADAMRMNRTDGALVRVSTPIDPDESPFVARDRVENFTAQLAPMLPQFIPN